MAVRGLRHMIDRKSKAQGARR